MHKSNYKQWKLDGKNLITSYQIIENNNYDIILVEDFPCQRKEQLHARERFGMENTNCINKIIPTRTHQEWYKDNKGMITEKAAEYYQTNKSILAEKSAEYYQKTKV